MAGDEKEKTLDDLTDAERETLAAALWEPFRSMPDLRDYFSRTRLVEGEADPELIRRGLRGELPEAELVGVSWLITHRNKIVECIRYANGKKVIEFTGEP